MDEPGKIEAFLPQLESLLSGAGLITVQSVQLLVPAGRADKTA
jgi:hypothetical protein